MTSENKTKIRFPVVKVVQPIGEFYVGVMKCRDLINISDVDRRHIRKNKGIDEYMGIQRELSKRRVREISQYVTLSNATFPTAVILTIEEQFVDLKKLANPEDDEPSEDSTWFMMELREFFSTGDEESEKSTMYKEIAKIIDGQHRIEGLSESEMENFEINVAVFVGADISDQATIFSAVNLTQTKVNKSLAYDLFSLHESPSPEKMCHEIAVALDTLESPFQKRIKRLGKVTEGRYGETLSQATVVKGILQHICKNQAQVVDDRKTGLKGEGWPEISEKESHLLVLRYFFIKGRDDDVVRLISNYFSAVSQKWPKSWNHKGYGNILNRTGGFNALMRFFRDAYLDVTLEPGKLITVEEFKEIFDRMSLKDESFASKSYLPGSSGQGDLYRELLRESGIVSRRR